MLFLNKISLYKTTAGRLQFYRKHG